MQEQANLSFFKAQQHRLIIKGVSSHEDRRLLEIFFNGFGFALCEGCGVLRQVFL